MKKNFVRILACVMAASAILTMTACGSDDNTSSTASAAGASSSVSSAVSSAPESSAPAESSEVSSSAGMAGLNANGKFDTIENFVNSDLIQSQLDSLKSSAEDSDMNIAITGEGNKLVYTFTYGEGTDTEGMAEALEAALDTQASTFEDVAASLTEAVEVEDPIVVVVYADSEGNEIYSREFTATAE